MRKFTALSIALFAILSSSLTGCSERRTRKVTVEGPEKKTELKLETTDKH